jgi:hypothetical protein
LGGEGGELKAIQITSTTREHPLKQLAVSLTQSRIQTRRHLKLAASDLVLFFPPQTNREKLKLGMYCCCRRSKWWWCLQTTTPPLCCWLPVWSRSVLSSPHSTCLWRKKRRSDIRGA